jgi:hypothetical protein
MPDSSTHWCWSVLPCQRCRVLRPASQKTEHVMFHRGDGTLQVGSIREEALTPSCHNTPQNSERTSGAMEDMSGKVQNANTHSLQCQNHEQAHSSRSVQGPVSRGRWRKCQGRFKMLSLTYCGGQNREHAHSSGSVIQFKGQFNGAMEEMSGKVQNASTHILRCQRHEHAHNSRSV